MVAQSTQSLHKEHDVVHFVVLSALCDPPPHGRDKFCICKHRRAIKKRDVFIAFFLLACFKMQGQPNAVSSTWIPKTSSSLASLDIQVPVGVFARSQFAGAGLNYSWSHRRYGIFARPSKWIGLTFNAGGDYYLGKKIKPSGYDFRFGDYIYLYALAGMIVNPWYATNISLTAGPIMGIYKGNSEMGYGVNLIAMYYLKDNISIGPGITYKKQPDTDALWSGVVRLSYRF
jgi:hypothetical protein